MLDFLLIGFPGLFFSYVGGWLSKSNFDPELYPRIALWCLGGSGVMLFFVDLRAIRSFEVFQRLHTIDEHPGSGIGLVTCQQIVERHDGDIWVVSELGDGSTFSFFLPYSSEPTP